MKIKINGIEKAGKTWRGSTKTKVYYLKRKCENRSSDIGMGKINNIRNGKQSITTDRAGMKKIRGYYELYANKI